MHDTKKLSAPIVVCCVGGVRITWPKSTANWRHQTDSHWTVSEGTPGGRVSTTRLAFGWARRTGTCNTRSGMKRRIMLERSGSSLVGRHPPQSNLLPAGEQPSRILFSNLFALLSSDIYTHFCLVGRYLHRVRRSKIFSKAKCCCKGRLARVLLNRWGEDEEGSNSDCKV